jgi:hypothetical protein
MYTGQPAEKSRTQAGRRRITSLYDVCRINILLKERKKDHNLDREIKIEG